MICRFHVNLSRCTLKASTVMMCFDIFGRKKGEPQVIMTHTCPTFFYNVLFQLLKVGFVRLSEVAKIGPSGLGPIYNSKHNKCN